MYPRVVSILVNIGALGLMFGALLLIMQPYLITKQISVTNSPEVHVVKQTATVSVASSTPIAEPIRANVPKNKDEITIEPESIASTSAPTEQEDISEIRRILNPYDTPPHEEGVLNKETREALVNILCEAPDGSVKSISGSGTIIDQKGVIITNAHVAQYILLSRNTDLNIKCRIRTGSPARETWTPDIIFFPSEWIAAHADDILKSRPVGTGENDYALVQIVASIDGSALPTTFPYLQPDTREAVGFTGDPILIAAYPAEFAGGSATLSGLYVSSVFTNIKQMLTFTVRLVDMLSLGGTAVAQSGSSGGAVLNMWGRLIAIVTTTSEGETTESRDLRAITLAHINRNIHAHTGADLESLLQRDPTTLVAEFKPRAEQHAKTLLAEIDKLR